MPSRSAPDDEVLMSSGWETLAVRDTPLSEAACGDFDGDGAADVFRAGCL